MKTMNNVCTYLETFNPESIIILQHADKTGRHKLRPIFNFYAWVYFMHTYMCPGFLHVYLNIFYLHVIYVYGLFWKINIFYHPENVDN